VLEASFYRINKGQVPPLDINITSLDNNFNLIYNDEPLFIARYQTVSVQRNINVDVNNNEIGTWSNWAQITTESATYEIWSDWGPHDRLSISEI
jgi:hypothetical protein